AWAGYFAGACHNRFAVDAPWRRLAGGRRGGEKQDGNDSHGSPHLTKCTKLLERSVPVGKGYQTRSSVSRNRFTNKKQGRLYGRIESRTRWQLFNSYSSLRRSSRRSG